MHAWLLHYYWAKTQCKTTDLVQLNVRLNINWTVLFFLSFSPCHLRFLSSIWPDLVQPEAEDYLGSHDPWRMSAQIMPEAWFVVWGRISTAHNSCDTLNLFVIYFLTAETIGFVDKLFECLTTKNYLGNPVAKEVPKEEVKPPAVKPDVVEVRRDGEKCIS